MNPVRGSSLKTPNRKSKMQGKNGFQQIVTDTQEPCTSKLAKKEKTTRPQKRKAISPAGRRKVKGQGKWKPLPKSTITDLEEMLDLTILSVLASQKTGQEETQKQLNTLKEMFLAKCAKLHVPGDKHGNLMHASRLLEEETKKAAVSNKILSTLEADVKAVVNTLASLEEQCVSLDSTSSKLRLQLEEEQLKSKEMLRQADKGVLGLPTLPPPSDSEPTLHDRLMRTVPIADRDRVASRLGKILHRSAPIKNAQEYLVHAHKHVDQLPQGGQEDVSYT